MTDPNAARDKRWIALILLCVAQFMVVLDSAIVNVALPTIGDALDFSESSLPWVVNAYVLTFGGFLLLGGRLADLLGRRRVLIFGLGLFALASLAGGLATSSGQLIAARAVQGLGAAILSPAALSIVTTTFKDGAERNKALGIWGGVAGSGAAAGVLLGGVLTESLGWEWVLWVNVPIGIAAVVIAPILIAETREEGGVRHFDIAGALTITLGISALVFALLDAETAGWGSFQTIGTLVASALLLAAFVVIERSSRAPLVPFSIFRARTVTGANVVGILTGAALLSMFYLLSLYMQQVLGYSPIHAGLSYLPLAVSIIISAGVASQLVTKVGFKPILAIGMALIAAGLAWFSQISVHGSFVGDILGPSLLAAVGLGLAFVPLTIAAVAGIADREQGLASGLINTSEQVGGALGLAILAAVANGIINGSHNPVVLTEGFQSAFLVGAAFAALGLIATLLLMRNSDSRAQVELSTGAAAAACSSSSEAAAVACASSSATATTAALQGPQAEGQARGGIATTSRIPENGPQGGDGA